MAAAAPPGGGGGGGGAEAPLPAPQAPSAPPQPASPPPAAGVRVSSAAAPAGQEEEEEALRTPSPRETSNPGGEGESSEEEHDLLDVVNHAAGALGSGLVSALKFTGDFLKGDVGPSPGARARSVQSLVRHHAEALSNSEDRCGRLEGQLEQALADCGEKDELLLALREEVLALKDNLRALDTQGSRLHAERDARLAEVQARVEQVKGLEAQVATGRAGFEAQEERLARQRDELRVQAEARERLAERTVGLERENRALQDQIVQLKRDDVASFAQLQQDLLATQERLSAKARGELELQERLTAQAEAERALRAELEAQARELRALGSQQARRDEEHADRAKELEALRAQAARSTEDHAELRERLAATEAEAGAAKTLQDRLDGATERARAQEQELRALSSQQARRDEEHADRLAAKERELEALRAQAARTAEDHAQLREQLAATEAAGSADVAGLRRDLAASQASAREAAEARRAEVADHDARVEELQQRLRDAEATGAGAAAELRAERDALQEDLRASTRAAEEALEKHVKSSASLQQVIASLKEEMEAVARDRDAREAEGGALRQRVGRLEAAVKEGKAARKAEAAELEGRLATQEAEFEERLATQEAESAAERARADGLAADLARVREDLRTRLSPEQSKVLIAKANREVKERKRIHNAMQDMKGAIRVFCRVRPFLPSEAAGPGDAGKEVFTFSTDTKLRLEDPTKGTTHSYTFDAVFGPAASQKRVFDEIAELVQCVVDGFNVCIFAYGQTGSGKTHTMMGGAGDPGVNVRALKELFKTLDNMTSQQDEWSTDVRVSMLEIYNETLRDLLTDGRPGSPGRKLEIRGIEHDVTVPGLTVRAVASVEDIERVLEQGRRHRASASTNMNEHSSRSHAILSVYASSENKILGRRSQGKLHLIDLAGSERVAKSKVTGDQLREAVAINKSLSMLGDIISALQKQAGHIPYRNSRLTHLLSDSMGGDAKVAMFVNCSPCPASVAESMSSLQFAEKVARVELGQAQRNDAASGKRGKSAKDAGGRRPLRAVGTPGKQNGTPKGTPKRGSMAIFES